MSKLYVAKAIVGSEILSFVQWHIKPGQAALDYGLTARQAYEITDAQNGEQVSSLKNL